MAGLVAYESSDEEEEVKPQPPPELLRKTEAVKADMNSTSNTSKRATTPPESKGSQDRASTVYGPQMAPSLGPTFPPLDEDVGADITMPPGSPYTATRALLRDLTLPAVADMDIPPSPPGSPSASTSKKFENFLELKKKGVHFNSRLAETPSMKNPALADKLMAFAELDHRDQYRTTLPADLWDVDAFPRNAYREQLRQSQSDIAQARARAPGASVNFVPSITSSSTPEDAKSITQMGSTGKRKTRFDT
ncbi:HCNGP-like protein-domain-containing protein [Xylaria nigripes]|nr:HCNGP-like protein-domain-containing protein [Xylaria nigripes]